SGCASIQGNHPGPGSSQFGRVRNARRGHRGRIGRLCLAAACHRGPAHSPGAPIKEQPMMRILVVEDSPTQARQLQYILEAEQFAVDVAADAEIALQRFGEATFDMVISDIMMPGLSGYELCDRIKNDPSGRDIPVILLSTLSDPMDIIRGLECGA